MWQDDVISRLDEEGIPIEHKTPDHIDLCEAEDGDELKLCHMGRLINYFRGVLPLNIQVIDRGDQYVFRITKSPT